MMEKRKLPFPTPQRMTEHAFAVLDAAVADAKDEPIALTAAIRLALCWVTVQGLTEPWQVDQFWQNMILPVELTRYREPYCRHRDMYLPVQAWKQNAQNKGLLPPPELWSNRGR